MAKPVTTLSKIEKRDIREIMETAFEDIGGLAAFVQWGRDNQTAFYGLWARMLPKNITMDNGLSLGSILGELMGHKPPGDRLPAADNTGLSQEIK